MNEKTDQEKGIDPSKREYRIIKFDYKKNEINEFRKNFADKHLELRKLLAEKKEKMNEYAGKISPINNDIKGLAYKIENGYSEDWIFCDVLFDWEKDVKKYLDPETGKVLEMEKIPPNTQRELYGDDAAENPIDNGEPDLADLIPEGKPEPAEPEKENKKKK